jgi:hypothetical protein
MVSLPDSDARSHRVASGVDYQVLIDWTSIDRR